MGRFAALAASGVVTIGAMLVCAAPASADPPLPGCQRDPMFGLNPQVREVCDTPIQPDGSWTRFRSFSHPEFVGSSCGGVYYQSAWCPWWNPYHDAVPAEQSGVETYVVTPDTIPAGEPGHIG